MAKIVGQICETRDNCLVSHFEWKIPHIKSVLQKDGDTCVCPYEFCSGEWTLDISRYSDCVYVHISRLVKTHIHKNNVKVSFMKTYSDGREFVYDRIECTVDEECWEEHITQEYSPGFLLDDKQEDFGAKINCLLGCFECRTEVPVVLSKGFGSLGRDLMKLFISGEGSDVTIKVKEHVFKVHKNIIRARSPVFFSMLKHDMIERRNGAVRIPDCEPTAFRKFLEYIYSGKLENCSKDIVLSLYYITDKYQVLEVKTECVNFLSKSLSVETFCDALTLSLRYDELVLLENAKKFFVRNSRAIIQTDRWLSFLKQNPDAANDFLIMVLVPDEKKRKRDLLARTDETRKKNRRNF